MTVVGSLSATNYGCRGIDSPGIVALDTSVVPDVVGLKAFYANAEPVQVLPGMPKNIIRVLVPDDRTETRGFHDILLEDMTTEIVPATLARDMGGLRAMWHKSLLSGMLKRQSDLESQHRECRHQFSGLQSGPCHYCGRVIVSSMTRHVMGYHLELAQLWRCPVPWCSIWERTVQDCVDHVRLRHHGGMLVKASTIGW